MKTLILHLSYGWLEPPTLGEGELTTYFVCLLLVFSRPVSRPTPGNLLGGVLVSEAQDGWLTHKNRSHPRKSSLSVVTGILSKSTVSWDFFVLLEYSIPFRVLLTSSQRAEPPLTVPLRCLWGSLLHKYQPELPMQMPHCPHSVLLWWQERAWEPPQSPEQ